MSIHEIMFELYEKNDNVKAQILFKLILFQLSDH